MPFDGFETPLGEIAKFDRVVALIGAPDKWIKHSYRNPNGYCLKEALNVVGVAERFEPIILQTAAEMAGRSFCCIESFNDCPQTSHADVLVALDRARAKIVAGAVLPSPVRAAPALAAAPRVRAGWAATLWTKVFG